MLTLQQISALYDQLQSEHASLGNDLRRTDDDDKDVMHKRIALLNGMMVALLKYKKLLDK